MFQVFKICYMCFKLKRCTSIESVLATKAQEWSGEKGTIFHGPCSLGGPITQAPKGRGRVWERPSFCESTGSCKGDV